MSGDWKRSYGANRDTAGESPGAGVCNVANRVISIASFHGRRDNARSRLQNHPVAGSSGESIEDAIQNAVGRASRALRQVGWFEVIETRGHVEDGKVAHYQVTIKVGFTLIPLKKS